MAYYYKDRPNPIQLPSTNATIVQTQDKGTNILRKPPYLLLPL